MMSKSRLLLGLSHAGAAAVGALLLYDVAIQWHQMVSRGAFPILVAPPVQAGAVPPTAPIAVAPPFRFEGGAPTPEAQKGFRPIVLTPEPPRPFFEVWSSNEQMGPEEKRVFEQARDALADNKSLPAHRAKLVSWLEANNLHVSNWTAHLTSDEPFENGHLVTLRITPRIGSPYSQVSILDWSVERYKVFNDGTWAFVDGTTPSGTGQPGWIID